MTISDHSRRRFLGLAAWATAGMTALGGTRSLAQSAPPPKMPEITAIREAEGQRRVRIAPMAGLHRMPNARRISRRSRN